MPDVKGILETNLNKNQLNDYYHLGYITINTNFDKDDTKLLNKILETNNLSLDGTNDEKYQRIMDSIKMAKTSHLDILEIMAKNVDGKEVYINESFVKNISENLLNIDKADPFNMLENKDLLNKMNGIKEENRDLIKFLNNNPNIFISKGAGNYTHGDNKTLYSHFAKITNNNLEQIKDISLFLYYIRLHMDMMEKIF